MFKEICDDEHDSHAMTMIHRAVMTILVCFLGFAGFAVATRLGAGAPPTSVAYGSEKPGPDATVFGD